MTARALLPLCALALGVAGAPVSAQTLLGPAEWPAVAAATFDSVWTRVRDTHFDPELGGVDWDAARAELRPLAAATASIEELRPVLKELLGRLGDSHFTILPASTARVMGGGDAARPAGDAGPGLAVRWIDARVVVTGVEEGGSADAAGVRTGWTLEAVDGVDVEELIARLRSGGTDTESNLARWVPAAVASRLVGPPGSSVELEILDGTDAPLTIALERRAPTGQVVRFGNLPPIRLSEEHRVERTESGTTFGYLRFSAWFPAVVARIADAVAAFEDVDAVIVDLRGNPGGVGGLVMGVGGHFLDRRVSLGTMRTRGTTLDFVANPRTVRDDGSRTEPLSSALVILVDPLTGSTSEIFAGGMQAIGRATIVGETTAGEALPAITARLPSGDVLMHAVADFEDPNGRRLEGVGVIPDVPVSLTREAFLSEEDPAMSAAIRYLTTTRP